jgi:hypothetical protein
MAGLIGPGDKVDAPMAWPELRFLTNSCHFSGHVTQGNQPFSRVSHAAVSGFYSHTRRSAPSDPNGHRWCCANPPCGAIISRQRTYRGQDA